jgi:signal transduction histidine kinase
MKIGKNKNSSYVAYSRFLKGSLVVGTIAFILLVFYFNESVIKGLRDDSARISQVYARLIQFGASEASDPAVIDFVFENIITKVNFPMIVTDKEGSPVAWTLDISPADTTQKSKDELARLLREYDGQNTPIPITSGEDTISILHYGDSDLISRIQFTPYIEVSIMGLFILIAYVGFRHIQTAEKRSIWVGMAKETAHQLGTPLSSLIGWVELLKMKYDDGKLKFPEENSDLHFNEISDRMLGDLKRLDQVATRFGQIGSKPELKQNDLNRVLYDVATYFRHRISNKGIKIIENYGDIPMLNINTELISWVAENLIKNSLEATDSETGSIMITTELHGDRSKVIIFFKDNGKGMTISNQKRIFASGFTTKTRGWGLGLTLAKRIIEEYHKGKIYLVSSVPDKQTIFRIELPV